MLLSLAAALGIGLASMPQGPPVIDKPCEATKEADFLAQLVDDDLRVEDPEAFVRAIQCLGDIKSIAAVNPLMTLLNYRRSFWWDGTGAIPRIVLPTGRYPAGGALALIGKPALPAVIRAIGEFDSNSVENEILFYVLLRIFLDDEKEGLSFLKKAVIVADSAAGRERLLETVQRYAAHTKLEENNEEENDP